MKLAQEAGPTDIHSLMTAVEAPVEAPPDDELIRGKIIRTDFDSLGGAKALLPEATPPRTWADTLIDALTPIMIACMVLGVIMFLLDVRVIYTDVMDKSLRFVAVCYVIAIVALNRIVARDGSDESVIYMFGLAGAIGLYTLATTEMYGMGSVTRNFMNSSPWLATGFNVCLAGALWWVVNRLTHECCVDENRAAGDIGIWTNSMRRFRSKSARAKKPKTAWKPRSLIDEVRAPMLELEPFDPVAGYQPKTAPEADEGAGSLLDRLPKRHPGMSIFYVSVPTLIIFVLGLRVVQHGAERYILRGWVWLALYAASALMLLMLTSLGGLREYFRSRKVTMPSGVGLFWMGLGSLMVAMVLAGAMSLPRPGLPPIAHVDEHVYDPWNRGGTRIELDESASGPIEEIAQSPVLGYIGNTVLVLFALFLLYGALKGLMAFAAAIGKRRDYFPRFVVRFFDWLDKLLAKLTRLPTLPKRKRRIRIQRDIATCNTYKSSLGDPQLSRSMSPGDHVEYAYQALCALAYDMGVARGTGQTPYEFLEAFPPELSALKAEAHELTRYYVLAAYSPEELDATIADRLRKFWITYARVRDRVLR